MLHHQRRHHRVHRRLRRHQSLRLGCTLLGRRRQAEAQMLRAGCTVCGRVYHFLGSKDPGRLTDVEVNLR